MKTELKIIHETFYDFNTEVFIEPHYLRLKPRLTQFNVLESYHLTIFPKPIGISQQYDSENNLVHFCWFDGLNTNFSIRTVSKVLLQDVDPLYFIAFPNGHFDRPFQYSDHLKNLLFAALLPAKIDRPLIDYGDNILEQTADKTLNFIIQLTRQIYADFKFEPYDDEPQEPDQTFKLKGGSSRALSWMQIQLLRHLGIAARSVIGYYFVESEVAKHKLHVWVEVYLPGAGWVGVDPSHGAIAGKSYIPLCSSSNMHQTLPITGSFRGDPDRTVEVLLTIEKISKVEETLTG